MEPVTTFPLNRICATQSLGTRLIRSPDGQLLTRGGGEREFIVDRVCGVGTLAGAAVEVVFRAERFPVGLLDGEGVKGSKDCRGGRVNEDDDSRAVFEPTFGRRRRGL